MMIKERNHDTGLRFLEILKMLLNEDLSKNEIIEKLRQKDYIEGVYTYEAFIKYFNTFERLGFKLRNEKNKYSLKNAVLKVDLTREEEKMLVKIIQSLKTLNSKEKEGMLKNIILKLDKYVDLDLNTIMSETQRNEKSAPYTKNVKDNLVNTMKNIIYNDVEVNITIKRRKNTEETIKAEIRDIKEKNGNVFVACYNIKTGRHKNICIDNITALKPTPERNKGLNQKDSVIFTVYGRLVNSYKIKEGEKILNFSNNFLTVSNSGEDKDALMLRLLKYGENCKIIKPDDFKEEFLTMTNEILKNLESA